MEPHLLLSLFHLFLVIPFLLYIGFQRASTQHWIYLSLLALGGVLFLYHGFRLFVRLRAQSMSAWVNALHLLLVAPLLMYIGYHKKETPTSAYELLLILAFGALGYHTYSLAKMAQLSAL